MIDTNDAADNAIILPADKTLLNKLGGVDLDKVFSPENVQKAEVVLKDAEEVLYLDCLADSVKLQSMIAQLEKSGKTVEQIGKVVLLAFGIKNKAGQSGYDLIAALAKSLQIRCEEITPEQATPTALKLIDWHVQSIARLLAAKSKGDGGETGKAILAQIEGVKLAS